VKNRSQETCLTGLSKPDDGKVHGIIYAVDFLFLQKKGEVM